MWVLSLHDECFTHRALGLELWLTHHFFPGRQSHNGNEVYQWQRQCCHEVGCSLHRSWHWGWSMSYVGLTSTSWIAIEPLFLLRQPMCFIDTVQCPSPAARAKSLLCRTIVSRWWMTTWAGFICPGWMQIRVGAQDFFRNIHNPDYHLCIIYNLIYLVNN